MRALASQCAHSDCPFNHLTVVLQYFNVLVSHLAPLPFISTLHTYSLPSLWWRWWRRRKKEAALSLSFLFLSLSLCQDRKLILRHLSRRYTNPFSDCRRVIAWPFPFLKRYLDTLRILAPELCVNGAGRVSRIEVVNSLLRDAQRGVGLRWKRRGCTGGPAGSTGCQSGLIDINVEKDSRQRQDQSAALPAAASCQGL